MIGYPLIFSKSRVKYGFDPLLSIIFKIISLKKEKSIEKVVVLGSRGLILLTDTGLQKKKFADVVFDYGSNGCNFSASVFFSK